MSLYLKLFGGLSLVDGETGAVRVTRRHRLAALAVLASAKGPVPRERLLALLWPDASDEGGRHSLGQVLYGLRQDVGLVELVGGATDLTLDRSAIDCDLWQWQEALARSDRQRMLEVYTGPFLDGVRLPNGDAFERWCEEERTALARQARDAMASLASAADARGDVEDAVRWWRRLAAADPISSRVALSLMRALVASGDRASAMQHARVHQSLVRSELEVDADPAVEAYVAEIRSAPAPMRVAAATFDTATSAEPDVPPPAEPHTERAEPTPAVRHRRRWLVLAAAVALVAYGSTGVLRRGAPARQGVDGVPLTAVVPFDVRGDATRGFLGEALSALLATRLDAPGVLRTLESNAVLRAIGPTPARGGGADARVVALGATMLVHGTVVVIGDRLEIDAQLASPDAPDAPVARANVSGSADSLFALADKLGAALLVARAGGTLGNALRDGPPMGGTKSVVALKSFLAGERAMRDWRLNDALVAYRDAVRIDSAYAMAWYRLGMAQTVAIDGDRGRAASDMASRFASELPPRTARLLAAVRAWHAGDYATAEPELLALVQRYPDDGDPWAELGEYRMHVGPLFGQPTSDAGPPLTRALVLDSAGHPEVRLHLAQLAMERGDTSRVRTLAAPLFALGGIGDPSLWNLRAMFALRNESTGETNGIIRQLRDAPADMAARILTIAIYSAGATPVAIRIADSLSHVPSSPEHQRIGLRLAQQLAIAGERWADALRAGATLAALDSVAAADAWSEVAVALDARIPAATWRNAGDVLEHAARGDSSSTGWQRRFGAATLAVRAGDERAYVRRQSAMESPSSAAPRLASEQRVLRALRADVSGDTATADRELSAMGPTIESTLGRWLRARSLERAGKGDVAARWYLSTPWGPDGIVLTRAALTHAAALAARRNDRMAARELSRRAEWFVGR